MAAEPLPPDPEEPAGNTILAGSQRPLAPPAPAPPRPGERYTRLRLHEQGGMGRVWLARDACLDRQVALKELRPELGANPISHARFLREALITGQLEHPGVVPVYELICPEDGRTPFYAMRFVKGRTLAQASADYHRKRTAGADVSLDFSALLHAFVTVCHTMAYAHSRGIIHRDLKGQNVILGDFGEVVILDWGLAKRMDTPDGPEAEAGDTTDSPDLTQQGQALGTPASMAPEQAAGRGHEIDGRTDIYGLGALLYEILTGQLPFTGGSTREVLRRVLEEEPEPPRTIRPDVPPGLEAVCLRALAKRPADRPAAAGELAAAVQRWQEAERRGAEEALRASEEKYRSLADLIPGIVWTARADGWIDYANQFWFRFTGLTMEQTAGSGWASVIHPDDRPRVSGLWGEALRTGDSIEVEYRIRRAADGVYRWFLAQARPVLGREGGIIRWFGMLTEIEDQKRGAQSLERENTLVRLLHQVTVAAYEAATFEAALQAGLDLVCASTGWPAGHVYVRAGDGLAPSGIWHLDRPDDLAAFTRVTAATPLLSGVGLPGRVLAGGQACWIMDVTRDDNFPRAKAAADVGVRGAFAFPVRSAAGVVAVLELFAREPKEPDEVLLRAMSQIGLQLGQVFERKRAEAELQAAREAACRAEPRR